MKYRFVSNYKDDSVLRQSFNDLTQKTFGFNLEDWYQQGFWGEAYMPYSLIDGKSIIANISVNLMNFDLDGTQKNYIQLGTVMTDKAYRHQGLSRYLMEHILNTYKNQVDGIYLFANDSVLDFYPKFGFKKGTQYEYSKGLKLNKSLIPIQPLSKVQGLQWQKFLKLLAYPTINYRLAFNNEGLRTFWLMNSQEVYYSKAQEAYVIAEIDEQTLFIKDIIAPHAVDLEQLIASFDIPYIKKVKLGFSPFVTEGYDCDKLHIKDSTFFYIGEDLKQVMSKKLLFPVFSHA